MNGINGNGPSGSPAAMGRSMSGGALGQLLAAFPSIRLGIIGDFCLDAYFMLDSSTSETSLETGLPTKPVRTQRYELGGAGNVAKNLHAMGVRAISVYGVIGPDPFGKQMLDLFQALGVDASGLLVQAEQWDTHVYAKPYERNREEHRIDFGNFNKLADRTGRELLARLEHSLDRLDLVIINEQVYRGVHTPEFRRALSGLITRSPRKRFIVDSRHFSAEFDGAIRKINIHEALALASPDETGGREAAAPRIHAIAQDLHTRWGTTLFLTRGDDGCLVAANNVVHEVPGLLITSPVDPVGAGDSMLAGISAALAAGTGPVEAALFGGFVAGVTVQKLFQTGTASPEEILRIGRDPDYRYRTELARRPDQARIHHESEIEIVTALPTRRFTRFLFDQDGTLSTLRQGWEEIMEPMMVKAILGPRAGDADDALRQLVVETVRTFIDRTTGVQTLVQMKGLVDLVRQFNCVPEEEILDEAGYKEIYNKELIGMVTDRVARLRRGDLDRDDFTVKRALPFLQALAARGVTLYLASGTDQEDVVREAEVLGYAHLFGRRIYGSVGDITRDAKRIVLERILQEIGPEGMGSLAAIGDGPVEIRETQKRGGYAIGVASSEIRRFGLNQSKRKRLIEAGADLVIPDFTQLDRLLPLLLPAD